MSKWQVVMEKVGPIAVMVGASGIGAWILCEGRTDLAQFGAGWVLGAVTVTTVVVALIWKPKE